MKNWNICTYCVYFKSKKELNYDRFVDPNIFGAARLVHSDLRIYRISFFLLDWTGIKSDVDDDIYSSLQAYVLKWVAHIFAAATFHSSDCQ